MRYGRTVAQLEDDLIELRRIGNRSQSISHELENVNPDRTLLLVWTCSIQFFIF